MIGETVAHYKILDKLGEGGMGEVWRAEDTTLGRDVAIKVLPDEFTSDPDRLARFEREARVLAAFEHSSIASIYGLENIDGRRFLVMQLAEGETLAERIDRGPIPVTDALKIARQITEGLEAAHDKGIIHRDLKPANIKLTAEGRVTILDFGLAKALETSEGASGSGPHSLSLSPTLTADMTSVGVLLGTAAYMSPEQARGESVDRRADIWAFGVVLMEMLTGNRVYTGKTLSAISCSIRVVFDRFDYHRRAVDSDKEAFFLRILKPGDYRYEGADLGILVTRGRSMTNGFKLTERSKRWIHGIQQAFSARPLPSAQAFVDPAYKIL